MDQCEFPNCNRDSSSNTIPHTLRIDRELLSDLRAIAVLLWCWTLDRSILGLAFLHEFLAVDHLIDSQGDSLRKLWPFDRHTRLGRSDLKLSF